MILYDFQYSILASVFQVGHYGMTFFLMFNVSMSFLVLFKQLFQMLRGILS